MADLLSVPLKKGSDVDIVKPLKNLIQSTYSNTEPAEYADALAELGRLRANAIWKVPDQSSLEAIYSYYDQIASLESKIPPQEVQIPFKWKDAFDKGSIFGGRMSLTVSSLSYERVCILFNMAAMQTAVAAQQSLDTEESLKLAAKLLQQAAGIFAELKSTVLAAVHLEPTPDLSTEVVAALAALALAQAQEVIAYKCVRDEMKDSMVAKVCSQCEELYTDALRALNKEHLRHLWDKEWLISVTAKQYAFRGLTQYFQSLVCRANKDVGEEIARLQLAVEGLRGSGGRLGAGGGLAVLHEVTVKAARNLAEARKDNDFIYHARVPDPSTLEPVPRAPVARAQPPLRAPAKWSAAGRDLFAGLQPLALHQAIAGATARAQQHSAEEINRLREATELLNTVLASLNLPACLEVECGAGELPESLSGAAEAVRSTGGGAALQRLLGELPDLLTRNRDILDETERLLREEAEADDALRRQFGSRWTRTASAQLTEAFRANAAKYRQILDNAVRADGIVQQKYQQHQDGIATLSGADEQLGANLPAAAAPPDCAARDTLRALMRQVETLKKERLELENELKSPAGLKEALTEALQREFNEKGGVAEEGGAALTAEALRGLRARVEEQLRRQTELQGEISAAAEGLPKAGGAEAGRAAALGALLAARDAYTDLTANLQEGIKFYNDLTQLLVAFQNKVSDYVFARRTEKEELLKDLTQDAARSSTAQEPAMVKREAPPRPAPPAPVQQPQAAQQPQPAQQPQAAQQPQYLPYPVQPQGMPLPYAAGAPYPYYAPVPQLYNPYATLPYPHHRAPPPQPGVPQYPYPYPPQQ